MKKSKPARRPDQKKSSPEASYPAFALRLNFRNVPLRNILRYLQDAAQLPIEVEPTIEIDRTIDLWDDKPVDKEGAIKLLNQALGEDGYTAIQKSGMLAIIRSQDAKKHYIPLPMLTCKAVAE